MQVEVVQAGGGDLDERAARRLWRVVEVADPRRGPVLVEDRSAQGATVSQVPAPAFPARSRSSRTGSPFASTTLAER